MRMGRVTVELSNMDKVLFPDDGITKGDLIDHYRQVADHMLPHVKGRPLALQRFPDGLAGEGFFQQEASDYFPDWVGRASVPLRAGGRIEHVVCGTPASLVYLANQATITLHAWLSHADRPDHPDQMIFDLDPPGEQFAEAPWAVAPYTVRARPGVPVATPLDWSELQDKRLRPQLFTLRTIHKRLQDDPWQSMPRRAQSLTDARHRLDNVRSDDT
jgi:DNA primase